MDVNTIFYCKFCRYKSFSVGGHFHHLRFHRNISKYLYCGLGQCQSSFSTESSLRCHIIRNHKRFSYQQTTATARPPQNGHGKFTCGLQHCKKEFFRSKDLMGHLRSHLESGTETPCPYSDCAKQFNSLSSLTGHISKKHRKVDIAQKVSLVPVELYPSELSNLIDDSSNMEAIDKLDIEETLSSDKEESLIALAQFYQKLEFKRMVPASVTQEVAIELKTLLTDMNRMFLNTVTNVLKTENLPSAQVEDILSNITLRNDVLDICNTLRTDYKRRKFFQDRFHFVVPEEVPLENGSCYYYIPIDKCIQAAFKNKSWIFSSTCAKPSSNELLQDFTDGETFKNNSFFQENPNALPLIFYQDGFELVCPIGPAKNLKHKLEGIYMAFGNLPSETRYSKDAIQLVAICKKVDFSRKEVYGRIVEDVKRLQEEGLDVPNIGHVKAGLSFIAGDNLGSHGLAGLLENFSRSIYFCRYCLVTRKQFFKEGGESRQYQARTPRKYDDAVHKVQGDPKLKSFEGVKTDSPFNAIHGFHVCAPALPPCIGHDLLEGVVAYDLKLFIQYFIAKKWFTLDELNSMIEKFPYSQEDKKDRPPVIKKLEKKRLAGSAWQLQILVRLFPLIVYGKILNANDPVWKLLLLLKDITAFCLSPKVHLSRLASFQCIINDYLELRKELFPATPLRPKHHYLSHAPQLMLCFGPLIKVWTMRFESKHTFFTRSWKSSNNSINILKTLAYKHEFLQSWVRCGGGLDCRVESRERSPFNMILYSGGIQQAVSGLGSLDECASVVVKGTLYKKGDVLILRQLTTFGDLLQVGFIHLILLDLTDNVLFLVQHAQASFVHKYGDFKLEKLSSFECVNHNDLMLSYYPHCTYIRDTETFVCLRHAVACVSQETLEV